MATSKSLSPEQAVDEYFDMLIKSRFIEMFNSYPRSIPLSELLSENKKGQWGTDPLFDETDKYVIKTSHMEYNGIIHYESAVRRQISDKKFDLNALSYGDILVEKSGGTKNHHVGYACVYLSDLKTVANNFVLILTPNGEVEPRFIHTQIRLMYERGEFSDCFNKTTGIENLKIQSYLSKLVCKPPILEQKAFVQFLEQVDKTKLLMKQCFLKFDQLVKSRFIEMFGSPDNNVKHFPVESLEQLSIGKLTYGIAASAIDYDGEIRYIRITDITENGGLNDDVKSSDEFDEKFILNDGDILFARSGATVGKTFQYLSKYGKSIYAGYLIRSVPDRSKVLPDYLFYSTKSAYYENMVNALKRGATQPNINAQQYSAMKFLVPPMDFQREFVEFVQQVDKSKFIITSKWTISRICCVH